MLMQRYKIKIEYEGTSFVGWQFQKNGQSVQEVLQKAIFNFSKDFPLLYGLISLIIAILIGWSGSEIFKRFRRT